VSTKKKNTKSHSWMEDGDDAHFSDNPAVPKKTRKKWRAEERKIVGTSGKGHPAVKVTKKTASKKTTRKRVAGK
jgi:hypothetical protein